MTLEEIILPESVLCNAKARSKKHCLEILSELLSSTAPDIPHEEIFSQLVERERLGCTGLEKGTAFPPCRIEGLEGSRGALIKLSSPIDFDTADGEFVDLVLGLMVPADMDDTHYEDVQMVTTVLADDRLRERLRNSSCSSELYQSLVGNNSGGKTTRPSAAAANGSSADDD